MSTGFNKLAGSASRIVLMSASAMAVSPAAAQSGSGSGPAGGSGSGPEEIVVTAQFREQNLQDTPIAITAVTSAMLEARSQTSIQDVANQAPSVTLRSGNASLGPSLGATIRGVGQNDFNPALEPGVGFYVDEVYYATLTGSIMDLLDLDRVEILRGPQGTLAGRNSIGGAIKLYSKRPTGSNTGNISATYGSRERVELRGSADFHLADGIDARISGVSKKQRGYVTRYDFGCVYPAGGGDRLPADAPINAGAEINPAGGVPRLSGNSDCVLGHEGGVGLIALRGQLRLRPVDTVDINLIADYTDDDRTTVGTVLQSTYYPNGQLASPRFPLPPIPPYTLGTAPGRDINPYAANIPYDTRFLCGRYCNFATYANLADGAVPAGQADGRIHFKGWGLSGQLEWDIADRLQLVSITAYRSYKSEFSNDNDLSPLAHSLGYGPLTFDFFSQELRLEGSLGASNALEYTIGGYYSDQKSVSASFQDLRYAGLRFYQEDPVEADSKAAFAQVSWTPLPQLTLNGGLRYTEESKTYTFSRRSPEGGVAPPQLAPIDGRVGTFSGHKVDYRANIQYRWSDALMTYVQYSTGFKGGGVNPRPIFVQQVLPFGPETLKTWEFGLKSDLFDRRLRINAAAFLSDYDGVQLQLNFCPGLGSPPTPCALITNAGNARIKGIEVETRIYPVEGLMLDGSVSYLDFDYKSINPSAGGAGNLNGPQFGDVPPYTPKWKWSGGAQYEFGLGQKGTLTPRFDVSYQGPVFSGSVNRSSDRIAAYTIANARLTWRNADNDLDVALEATNLFNKYYFFAQFDATVNGNGYTNGAPGRPREFALTVKKIF